MIKKPGLKITQDEYIRRAQQRHGEFYDYSLVNYNTINDTVAIICLEHGIFYVNAEVHIVTGGECKECILLKNKEKILKKINSQLQGSVFVKSIDFNGQVVDGRAILCCETHGDFEVCLTSVLYKKKSTSSCVKCSEKRWQIQEDDFLIKNYQKEGASWCAKKLNTTRSSIANRAHTLKISKKIPEELKHPHISRSFWCHLTHCAKDRNIEVKILPKDVWNQYLKQDGKCALTGQEIFFEKTRKNTTVSVDRIDSTKGYLIDNIQMVRKDLNAFKGSLLDKELFKICRDIYYFRKKDFEI